MIPLLLCCVRSLVHFLVVILFFSFFVVFYCIVTISVFCYIFFVLFCLVITLFNFYNLFLKFSQQKVGSWEDRQYCLYETTVDSQNYVWTLYLYIYICLWLFAEIYTYLLTYLLDIFFSSIFCFFIL